jgi:hypothetical protein
MLNNFFSGNRAVYEIMWKNVVQLWHVISDKMWYSSGTSYLTKCGTALARHI